MFAVCLIVILALLGSEFKGNVQAGDAQGCPALTGVLKHLILLPPKWPLPHCQCGPNGSIRRIVFTTGYGHRIERELCSGCEGPDVPTTLPELCHYSHQSNLDDFIRRLAFFLFCKIEDGIEIYRCGCTPTTEIFNTPTPTPIVIPPTPTTSIFIPLDTTTTPPDNTPVFTEA